MWKRNFKYYIITAGDNMTKYYDLAKDNKEITEENLSQYLYQDIPPLDLVIRTSGEYRLSNFMLWQASYAELYFTKVYFPDFDEHEFDLALEEYNHRHRRFGGN